MENKLLTFQCPGKLFITGEYAVLHGALSLVVPVHYTQNLMITPSEKGQLHWTTTWNDTVFLSASIQLNDFSTLSCSDSLRAAFLTRLLKSVRRLNPNFLVEGGYRVRSVMGANPQWGFGSSAQLTVNVARWAGVDALVLHRLVSSGSGADVACSLVAHAIHYSISMKQSRYHEVSFKPPFADKLLLVYTNRKQDSATSVRNFLLKRHLIDSRRDLVSQITLEATQTSDIHVFAGLMAEHERLLSAVLKQPPVQETQFNGFPGVVKSLGAWGGDFVLAIPSAGMDEAASWFLERGYDTLLPFHETVLLD